MAHRAKVSEQRWTRSRMYKGDWHRDWSRQESARSDWTLSFVCWTWDVALGARETAPSDGRVRGNGSIATSGRISGLTIVRYATPSECWEQV